MPSGIPAVGSRFHELVDVLGIDGACRPPHAGGREGRSALPPARRRVAVERSALQQTGSESELAELRRVFGATDDDLTRLGEFYLAMITMSDEDLAALDEVGTMDFVRPFGLPTGLLSQIYATLNMLFVAPVDRLAASEAVLVLRNMVTGGAGRFHRGGYGQVAEACAEVVVERGGTFLRSTRVQRILVDGGRAVGVTTDEGDIRAPVVISNAGVQPTVLNLVGAEQFPDDYVDRIRDLEPSWAIAGVRYVFDEPRLRRRVDPDLLGRELARLGALRGHGGRSLARRTAHRRGRGVGVRRQHGRRPRPPGGQHPGLRLIRHRIPHG